MFWVVDLIFKYGYQLYLFQSPKHTTPLMDSIVWDFLDSLGDLSQFPRKPKR